MHGGGVAVESGGSQAGTTFTVRLPLVSEPRSGGGFVQPEATPEDFPHALRVLIVDDHVDTAQALALLLTRRNCEVRVRHDGPGGTLAAKEFNPEVLLLDLGLPGLDGYEIAGALRAEPALREALFIAISGYAQESDRARALAAGFDHHCAKPVDLASLLSVIRTKFSQVRSSS